jgi:POT family proton-dependent oligopeptide transporter
MSRPAYATAPRPTPGMPAGIPYIIGNEAAERFSYYGMRAVLVIFMTQYLMGADGELAPMNDEQAKSWYHLFGTAVYATPLLGALLSDIWAGKYRTILGLSIVYCLGHLALALDDTRTGLALGLGLIALGSGGIKPCVSAHVGDQFGRTNAHLLRPAFAWFYFSINLGAAVSTLLTPILLDRYGPHAAFGLPGLLMSLATIVFWAGRREFVHIPPGGREFARQLLSRDGLGAIARLSVIFVFIVMFWALFDQTGSAWVIQARSMDRHFLGIEFLPSQIQAVNPLLVMALIPFFNFVVYPTAARFFEPTPLRRIGAGFFIAVAAFLVNARIEVWIAAGEQPSIGWQLLAYLILTSAEVLVSITALEFSYTQAPPALKSVVMALNLMSMSLGNLFTALVNIVIQDASGTPTLDGAAYYLFFAGAMFGVAVLFVPVALLYRGRTFLQDEAQAPGAGSAAPASA